MSCPLAEAHETSTHESTSLTGYRHTVRREGSALQELVDRTQHILPIRLHNFLIEPVLVVPETDPQFACKGVPEQQHSSGALPTASGQGVELDSWERSVFVYSIEVPQQRKAKESRGRHRRLRGLCWGRRWRRRGIRTALLFIVFFRPLSCTSTSFLRHQTTTRYEHGILGYLCALSLGRSRSVPERRTRLYRAGDEVWQNDIEVAHREKPVGIMRRTYFEVRPKVQSRIHHGW